MSETNGTAREAYRELRTANRLEIERIKAAKLGQMRAREERRRNLVEALSIDWVTPYAELLDLTRRTGDPVFSGPTSMWQRRHGRNWPIYQTEADLNLLRAPARILLATNGYAQGLVEGITSYLLGPGETFRIAKADEKDQEFPKEAIAAAQDVVDEILDRNQWHGGEQPGIGEELVGRSIEEGEFLLLHYRREDGWTDFRIAEPEQLTQPPGTDWQEWSFGIMAPRDDAQDHRRYYIQYGDSPNQGEEYDPEEVTHFRRNVRRGMKRGVTDFCFDTYDAIYLASRLRTNLADTAAQQAAIVGVRQHDSGAKEDIQSFVDADADFTETEYLTGTQKSVKMHRRGSWEDIPKGLNYVAGPIATSQPIHIQVLEMVLKAGGKKWQAPSWMTGGGMDDINFASSLTIESPFVRTILRRQRPYSEAFRRPVWLAFEHYVRTNGLRDRTGKVWTWDEIADKLKLLVSMPSPETRNKLEESQRASIEIPLGVQSRQKYAQEQGRDFDQIAADNQEYEDRFGAMGQQLPIPGEGGGDNPFKPRLPDETRRMTTEGLLESVLLEHGFTGKDRLGRQWVDGKLVPSKEADGKGADPKGSGTFPG